MILAGNSNMNKQNAELPVFRWAPVGPSLRRVQLTSAFKSARYLFQPILTLDLREFMPGPKDILAETWCISGEEVVINLPPYACVS
jgi:hypothetical protein